MSVVKLIVYYTESAAVHEDEMVLQSLSLQKAAVQKYVDDKNREHLISGPYGRIQSKTFEVQKEYSESVDRKMKKFPVLEIALQEARRMNALLIIPELQDLIRNEVFTGLLLRYETDFQCLDQPSINKNSLPTLVETFQRMRARHSQRIRHALKQTVARLGNPNALKEITKVNKPKRENAIMFALMLAPIIDSYKKLGFSQRRMVDALNSEGYLAPEGGQWVLSQLQKVLERIDMNVAALSLSETLKEFADKAYSEEQQVKALNAMNAKTPNRSQWDIILLQKVKERLAMIRDIMSFNQFVLNVFPQVMDFDAAGLSDEEIADKLNEQGVQLPQRLIWEIQHEQESEEIVELEVESWTADEIELVKSVASRRQQDIQLLLNPNTMHQALHLIDKQLEAHIQ